MLEIFARAPKRVLTFSPEYLTLSTINQRNPPTMNIKTLNARLKLLGPASSRPWRKDPLEVARSILPVEELRRESGDGIIADFILTVSDEKTFRAYLRKAKKGLEPHDYD